MQPMTYDELLRQAKRLPEKERAAFIDALLDDGLADEENPAEVEKAWADEIARRLAMVESGAAELQDWEEARQELRRNQHDQAADPGRGEAGN